jgi:heme A synthase
MTDPLPRPAPRWLHIWAVVTVVATVFLLAIGQFVTSFGAGMADRVWPTEPWYISHTATEGEKTKFRKQFDFFIEHSHRIAGWTVGILVSVLAVGILWTEPRKAIRWVSLAGLVLLIAGYGEFHRGLRVQSEVAASELKWPLVQAVIAVAGALVMLGAVTSALFAGGGAGLRLYAALALVAVMIQGLLGGFRVRLNELIGPDLAAFHGVFAQVVFGLLVSVAVLTRAPLGAKSRLSRWVMALAHLVFLQVIFGAWLRHFPSALPQRLHFLTAFAATAMTVWLLRAIFADPVARSRAGWVAWALGALLVLQLMLGVEAWMMRFGQYLPPEMVKVTPQSGAIRSFHALVGSGLWGASLALALRLRTTAAAVNKLEPIESPGPGSRSHAMAAAEAFRGDAQ